jgi:hypothetical protein
MRRSLYWGIFATVQALGVAGLMTGGPHSFPLVLVAALILLFPGSVLGLLALDRLGIQIRYATILESSLLVNIVCWYASLGVAKLRSRKAN